MFEIIRAEDRNYNDFGWLQTYWLFSFSNYYDPDNMNHGLLRVFNDDVVQPQSGFGIHPHEEMEIISLVLRGEMTHKDSMGNETIIRAGDVQRMTAGTGLQHSEMNEGHVPVAFFQIWILPGEEGQTPSYDQKNFVPGDYRNRLTLIASNRTDSRAVTLNTDALLYRACFTGHHEEKYSVSDGRVVFIYVIEGELNLNGSKAGEKDQIRVAAENELEIAIENRADFVLIDIPGKKTN